LVTDVLEFEGQLVSCSLDGTVVLSQSGLPQKTLNFNGPLWRMKRFGDWLYVCGKPSVRLNLRTLEHSLLEEFLDFEAYTDAVYGCGYTQIVNTLNNVRSNDPCSVLLNCKGMLLGFRERAVGKLVATTPHEVYWKWQPLGQLEDGYEIRDAVLVEDSLYVVGDRGKIIILSLAAIHDKFP
jgi:hypothetical protein